MWQITNLLIPYKMKKIIILFIMIMSISTISYSQSIKIDKPVLDGGARALCTSELYFAEGIYPRKEKYNTIRYKVDLLTIKANSLNARKKLEIKEECAYMIHLSLECMHEMYISKGKTVIFKLSNGTNLLFKTMSDIDKNYDEMILARQRGWYNNTITIDVTKQQLKKLIAGKVVKIRVIDDLTDKIDVVVEENKFSNSLNKLYDVTVLRLTSDDETEGF